MIDLEENFSKPIVMLIILLNVIFTVAVLYVFLQTSNEPQVLVGSWFTFTTVELWAMAKIKRDKIKRGDGDE